MISFKTDMVLIWKYCLERFMFTAICTICTPYRKCTVYWCKYWVALNPRRGVVGSNMHFHYCPWTGCIKPSLQYFHIFHVLSCYMQLRCSSLISFYWHWYFLSQHSGNLADLQLIDSQVCLENIIGYQTWWVHRKQVRINHCDARYRDMNQVQKYQGDSICFPCGSESAQNICFIHKSWYCRCHSMLTPSNH
jgi:hypothetical protein